MEGEELAVGVLKAFFPTLLQAEDVVNNALNVVAIKSTGHALTGASHGGFRLLIYKKYKETFRYLISDRR